MQEIKFCPKCGHQINAAARFCENCGFPVTEEAANQQAPFQEAVPDFQVPKEETINETPIVEKNKYTVLNYSQILRIMMFQNPFMLISGAVGFVFALLISLSYVFFFPDQIDIFFYLFLGFAAMNLASLFIYLIITPLRSIRIAKQTQINEYQISFYSHALRYKIDCIQNGRPCHTNMVFHYQEIARFKEFKDMTLLLFVKRGMQVPLCILKDENYSKVKELLQSRFDELRRK